MSNQTKTLRVLGIGPNGVLLTDETSIYMVWESKTSPFKWVGLKVQDPSDAFDSLAIICGAEVDMRQSDEDEMTDEIMDLGNLVADTLTSHFDADERRLMTLWRSMQEKK